MFPYDTIEVYYDDVVVMVRIVRALLLGHFPTATSPPQNDDGTFTILCGNRRSKAWVERWELLIEVGNELAYEIVEL